MGKRTLATLGSLILIGAGAVVGNAEEMLLYTPQPATAEQAPASPREGVLVQTVTVKRGDTLAKLSREHIGISDYFPQILVFNRIKNPDLIHPGDKLRVPVRPGKQAKKHVSRSAAAGKSTAKKRFTTKPFRLKHASAPAAESKKAAPLPAEAKPAKSGEREQFERAQRAYLKHDYREALAGFDTFLHTFPNSAFAADASLYRADCFLHLSGE